MGRKKQYVELGPGLRVDVPKLIEDKLLIQANSGGGKSYAIRKLLEVTHGLCQHIVIDPDGEFYTLRERFDYVLAAPKSKECRADLVSAAKLAIRLLELGTSAIIDIYELGINKRAFVKKFCEALVNSPRELWHPLIIVIDEAHIFAPEKGKSGTTDGCREAVAQLASLGRKRGFGVVLATQRVAKLDKDTAAECNNKLIGRCSIDVDRKRAGEELGFTKKEQLLAMRALDRGEFYAFGPAISDEVTLRRVGLVETTHLRAGKRTAKRPVPSAKVKKVLGQLADIPHEAEEEAKTAAEWQAKYYELLKKAPSVEKPIKVTTKEIVTLKKDMLRRLEKVVEAVRVNQDKLGNAAAELTLAANVTYKALDQAKAIDASKAAPERVAALTMAMKKLPPPPIGSIVPTYARGRPTMKLSTPVDGPLPKGEHKILTLAIQRANGGVLKKEITTAIGYKRQTRDAYISRLRDRGLVTDENGRVRVALED